MSDPKKGRKVDLSKYVDANVLNFDKCLNQKRTSIEKDKTAPENPAKFSIDAVESENSENSNENSAPAKATRTSSRTKTDALKAAVAVLKIPSRAAVPSVSSEQKSDDAVPGIHSKPKRVSFIASEPEPAPEAAPVVPPTVAKATAKAEASTRSTPVRESAKPQAQQQTAQPVQQAHSQQPVQQQQQGGGILTDPARHIELNGRQFIRLNVLGKGGSSCVYRIIGADDGQIYAYKRVEVRDTEDVDAVFDNYANEIALLRRLSSAVQGTSSSGSSSGSSVGSHQSRIIELVDFEVRRDRNYIAMILEAGDIDLAKVLTQKNARNTPSASAAGTGNGAGNGSTDGAPQSLLDPFFARMVWREMLEAVDHIHTHRIVHGDLKPANFVFVKGHLKLIDFGIAKSFNNDTTNIYRESQIGTVNYMAPEAIAPMSCEDADGSDRNKMRLGRASDIWSLGCILYQMVYGRPPFAALNTIQKLSSIPNPKTVIKYPEWGEIAAVESMRACLVHDPRARAKIQGAAGLLEMSYLKVQTPAPGGCSSGKTVAGGATVIGKEQVQSLVGAVLDSLSSFAQADVEKAQAAAKASGISTRRGSGRANAEAVAAENLARGVVRWIDEVDQEVVEGEVMDVVEKEGWNLAAVPLLPATTAGTGVTTSGSTSAEATSSNSSIHKMCDPVRPPAGLLSAATVTAPTVDAVSAVTSPVSAAPQTTTALPARSHSFAVTSSAVHHLLGSPVALKRKAAESTPGSVTRSGAKRAAMHNRSAISVYEDAVPGVPHTVAAVVPEERPVSHAAPPPAPVAAPVASAAAQPTEPAIARSSTWAHPVFISAVRHTGAGSHPSSHPCAPDATAPGASTSSGVKPFNPKPAFLSNILGSNSRLTSFLNAPTFVTTDASSGGSSSAAPSSSSVGALASCMNASVMGAPARKRSPLKALPLTLQQQIKLNAEQRLNKPSGPADAAGKPIVDRAAKWIKPAPVEEPNTLQSALEKRMDEIRKVMGWDEETENVTETVDITGFNF